ncbi:MAG: I78 family peptidase inhibitor [Acidovorax sp.]
MRRLAYALVPAALLAGCSGLGTPPPPLAPPPVWKPQGGECNAAPAQGAVGQNATATVTEQARKRSGALMARILRPGQVVTKEYDTQRLNLEVDATGRIVAVRCG